MASSPKAPADPIDARLVRKLADILTETGLTEIEVERDDLKIRVAKTVTAAPAAQYVAAPAQFAAPAPSAPAAGEPPLPPSLSAVARSSIRRWSAPSTFRPSPTPRPS